MGFVGAAPLFEHTGEHRLVKIGVVVDAHLTLVLVEAMQTSNILSDGASPRYRHCQEQGVEAGLVEALADESARGQNHLRLAVLRYARKR